MEKIKFSQFGTLTVGVLSPLLAVFSLKLLQVEIDSDFNIQLIVIWSLIICLLLFYKLTVTIDEYSLSFRMGIGLIRKKIKLLDIKSCKPVTNSIWNGFGIHYIGNGWLYNVSGMKSIELEFHNKKSIIRIGTNKPEEMSQLINELIQKQR